MELESIWLRRMLAKGATAAISADGKLIFGAEAKQQTSFKPKFTGEHENDTIERRTALGLNPFGED